jgi:hypothetical protein
VKGGKTYLHPINLLPLQNSRSPGTSPLGLTSLKRKNLPIVVTLGGIGSCYASLAFYLIAFTPSYKLCDNRPTVETLNWYDPPETLNMINNSAWMNEASESLETL